jgi:hypothetical protein
MVTKKGLMVPLRPLYNFGVANAIRSLLQSKKWSKDHELFDAAQALQLPHSIFNSYNLMSPDEQRRASIRFLKSGQTGEPSEQDIRTMIMFLEGGTDGFKPFIRRQWSTIIFGYR